MHRVCACFFMPNLVLEALATDPTVPAASREAFAATQAHDVTWRPGRGAPDAVRRPKLPAVPVSQPNALPPITIYDSRGTNAQRANPVADPAAATDPTIARAWRDAVGVATFFRDVFGRNSVDDRGMALASMVHFKPVEHPYVQAAWFGKQMFFGDADGFMYLDYTLSNDVVAHEMTHGMIEAVDDLAQTEGESGALAESISDAFGSMYRQWEGRQAFGDADWLMGAGIMGPGAKQKGQACIRDLARPGAVHCVTPQPDHVDRLVPNGEVHINSGIGNHAFWSAANSLGGRSWEVVGQVWYAALTSGKLERDSGYRDFAGLTRQVAQATGTAAGRAVDHGWTEVGL